MSSDLRDFCIAFFSVFIPNIIGYAETLNVKDCVDFIVIICFDSPTLIIECNFSVIFKRMQREVMYYIISYIVILTKVINRGSTVYILLLLTIAMIR